MELELGITKHKCATLREAQVLAECGVPDVLIAYPMVGPNPSNLARLVKSFPSTNFSVILDSNEPGSWNQLAEETRRHEITVNVLLDVNVGQNRTGIASDVFLLKLFLELKSERNDGLRPGGLHVYDGHNSRAEVAQRERIVQDVQDRIRKIRNDLRSQHVPLPRIVIGGTPAFALHAKLDLPEVELSPGTCVLHDWNYGRDYPELGFTPAAVLLTRCVSRPTPNRVTFDLGTKAVCADPPAGKRCLVLGLENAVAVAHNEEHLVLETTDAEKWNPGDVAYAIPAHVCPTVAMYRWAQVVEQGNVVDKWEITARDRELTI